MLSLDKSYFTTLAEIVIKFFIYFSFYMIGNLGNCLVSSSSKVLIKPNPLTNNFGYKHFKSNGLTFVA